MSKMVYLSGPISYSDKHPFHWESTHNWRFRAERELGADNCLNPARREYPGELTDEQVDTLVTDDLDEIEGADVLLAHVWQHSPGTSMEMFFARNILGIPVVTVCPKELRKPWIRYVTSHMFNTLDEALTFIKDEYLNEISSLDSLDVARSG